MMHHTDLSLLDQLFEMFLFYFYNDVDDEESKGVNCEAPSKDKDTNPPPLIDEPEPQA